MLKRIYKDNVLGKITNEIFRKLSDNYLAEQKEIQTTFLKKESDLERLKDSVSNVSTFIGKAKQYTEINYFTTERLHLFLDRVEVEERTENSHALPCRKSIFTTVILDCWTMSLSRHKSKTYHKHL